MTDRRGCCAIQGPWKEPPWRGSLWATWLLQTTRSQRRHKHGCLEGEQCRPGVSGPSCHWHRPTKGQEQEQKAHIWAHAVPMKMSGTSVSVCGTRSPVKTSVSVCGAQSPVKTTVSNCGAWSPVKTTVSVCGARSPVKMTVSKCGVRSPVKMTVSVCGLRSPVKTTVSMCGATGHRELVSCLPSQTVGLFHRNPGKTPGGLSMAGSGSHAQP